MKRMTIGIDCRLSGLQHAGIGRYTQHLVRQLLSMDTQHTWVLFFSSQSQANEVLAQQIDHPNIKNVISPVQHYTVMEQLLMPWYFHTQKLDILHVPHFNVPVCCFVPLVVTIHDLLWHSYKGKEVTTLSAWQYMLKYQFYKLVTSSAVAKARAILVPTQTVAQSLAEFYPRVQNKVVVTYEGVDVGVSPQQVTDNDRGKHNLLYVGSLYPHKNLSLVLRALTMVPEFSLTIVSARNVFSEKTMEEVQKLGLQQRVSFVGKVTDAQLATLYAEAAALIQPSLSEGFGLTGIEALAMGTPVIASDIPTFREVYKDTVLFFNPTSPESFVTAVQSLGTLTLTQRMNKAQQVVETFNWQRMAEQTLATYEQF